MASSFARGDTDVPLLDLTIGEQFARTVAASPDTEALVDRAAGRRWTWRELGAEVDAMAAALVADGVAAGDRIGIWAPNRAEWTVVQLATAAIGAILVTINPAYRRDEFAYVAGATGLSILFAQPEHRGTDYRAMIDAVRADADGSPLRRVVFFDTDDWPGFVALGDEAARAVAARRATELSPDQPINIQFTSGTTGLPKGVTLSHRNILNNGHATTEIIGLRAGDRLCVPVPFYHCFGMVMGTLGCLTHAATIVIPAPVFSPVDTLAAIAEEHCTGVYGVPTMFIAMLRELDAGGYDLSSLRTGIMAGSVCPIEIMRRAISEMHLTDLCIAYGMTETSPVSCQTRIGDDLERRTETIGRVHPHVEIKIVDPATGAIVPRGTPGELCTRGYSVMLGYWNDPVHTAEVLDADGWMHTGDLATMRDDGYCRISGRIKDLIIRGGENISPREIEDFFYAHPDIEDIQVIGVPDELRGEEICAWVTLRDPARTVTAESLRTFAEGRLAHYKMPRYVLVVEAFPQTVTGKVRKAQMRQETPGLLAARA
jgi:fatty-acyl-CoA synthase